MKISEEIPAKAEAEAGMAQKAAEFRESGGELAGEAPDRIVLCRPPI
ncbi:MAG: hypothetical protein WD737_13940 [Gemmatimonadota bacterium]